MENNIIYKYHDEMRHYGIESTVNNIIRIYWFPKLKQKVERHIKNCLKCIGFSAANGRKESLLHNIPKENVSFHTLHIEFLGSIEKKMSFKTTYIFSNRCFYKIC